MKLSLRKARDTSKHRHPFPGSSLRKLYSSLFLVLLIPCTILCLLYRGFLSKAIAERVSQVVENEQRAAVQLMEADLRQVDEAYIFFERCEGFQSYVSTHRFFTDEEGIIASLRILSDVSYIYCLQNQLEHVFVWLTDTDTILSINGMYRPDVFFSQNFIDQSMSTQELTRQLLSQEKPALHYRGSLLLRGEVGEYLTFTYPLTDSKGSFGTAVFSIGIDQILDYFSTHTEDLSASVLVFDEAGDYLFSSGADAVLVEAVLAEHALLSRQDAGFSYGSTHYQLLYTESTQTGWTIVTLLPQDSALYSSFFPLRQFLVMYLLLCAFFGLFTIALLARLNYAPIRSLKQMASAVKPPEAVSASGDDIEDIAHTLDYLQSENDHLKQTYRARMRDIQNNCLLRLLNDFYPSVEDFNNDCEQIGLTFSYDTFFVSSFLLTGSDPDSGNHLAASDTIFLIAEELKPILGAAFSSHYIISLQPGRLVFLHNVPDDTGAVTRPFTAALQMLQQRYELVCCVGISRCCTGTASLGKALLESASALDYRFVCGKRIIFYQDILGYQNTDQCYPVQELKQLQSAVQSRDRTLISAAIDLLNRYISDSGMPTFIARCVCFDITKMLLPMPENPTSSTYPLTQTLMYLNETESVDAFLDIILDLLGSQDGPEAQEATVSAQDSGRLLHEVIEYIWKNYTRCNFSIQEVAEALKLSPSALSNLFKAQMGCSLQDYLIRIRMEKAKELLRQTRLTLKDVALSVGYYNVSSFIRRFKAQEGVTPNTYRFKQTGKEPE